MAPDPVAALAGQATLTRVPTLKFRVDATEVAHARHGIRRMLCGLVPTQHLDDLELCTSELVTNAIRAAVRYANLCGWTWTHYDEPVHLGVETTARWTRLDVRDPDPAIPAPAPGGLLDTTGRGLVIVGMVSAHCWWTPTGVGKTFHAVVAMPDATLTSADLVAAER